MKLAAAAAAAVVLPGVAPACAAPPLKDEGPAAVDPPAPNPKAGPAPVSERFPNLDAYLAYLEARSRMDGPWYRQVRPGVYELQTGNLRLPDGSRGKRIFTREELERKFGFAR